MGEHQQFNLSINRFDVYRYLARFFELKYQRFAICHLNLKLWPLILDKERVSELIKYGIGAFIISASIKIIGQTDLVIVGPLINVEAVSNLMKFWELFESEQENLKDEIKWLKKIWWCRIYGYWFYNDGEPTFLPPDYFDFLTFYYISEAECYPEYRDDVRRKFDFAWYRPIRSAPQHPVFPD